MLVCSIALLVPVGSPGAGEPVAQSWRVTVREGGGMEPPPHRIVIGLTAENVWVTGKSNVVLPTDKIAAFTKAMQKLRLGRITQKILDRELLQAGGPASMRGGSGVVTLSTWRAGKEAPLRLDSLEKQRELPIARRVAEAIDVVRALGT